MCSLSFSLVADPRGWVFVRVGAASISSGWACYVACLCFRLYFLLEDYGEYEALRRGGRNE